MTNPQPEPENHKINGLSPEEITRINEILEREGNPLEQSIFAAMWSEHTSYKSSAMLLKKLPVKGQGVLIEAGKENAGAIDLGDGLACVFKIESHNHPCAISPYHGAASGVGGIHRDILAMGAKPVAQLNSIRVGEPEGNRNIEVLNQMVKGMGDYANALGIPMVGGEVYFDKHYQRNPLLNVMSVGIVEQDKIVKSAAKGKGNPVYIVGAQTGKDGLHGARFASRYINGSLESGNGEGTGIFVGDPFMENLLIEALLEVNREIGIAAMQDLAGGGIICCAAEMAARGKSGIRVEVSQVPLADTTLAPEEILFSETQERMMLVLQKKHAAKAEEIFAKWEIPFAEIGYVTNSGTLDVCRDGELLATLPIQALVQGNGSLHVDRQAKEPSHLKQARRANFEHLPEPENIRNTCRTMISLPNLSGKKWIIEQFDTLSRGINMSTNFPSDAAVINIRGTDRALVLTVDCNARYVHGDPEKGAQIAVMEAARNIICSGGEPKAITNCLNFGDPSDPSTFWTFTRVIKGITAACNALDIPVTGGNVSFNNFTRENGKIYPVLPTPVIGMVGLLHDKNHQMTMAFKNKGDMIFLIGKSRNDLGGSEYIYSLQGFTQPTAPWFDLETELAVQKAVKGLIRDNLVRSAHDVSEGGILLSLVESAIARGFGFDITTDAEIREDEFLFGEAQGRIIVTVTPNRETEFIDFMIETGVPFCTLGHVTKEDLRVDDESIGFISDIHKEYTNALENKMINTRPIGF